MKIVILDSVVVASRTCRLVDCEDVEIVFETTDCRKVELFRTKNSRIVVIDTQPILDQFRVIFREECKDNVVQVGDLTATTNG